MLRRCRGVQAVLLSRLCQLVRGHPEGRTTWRCRCFPLPLLLSLLQLPHAQSPTRPSSKFYSLPRSNGYDRWCPQRRPFRRVGLFPSRTHPLLPGTDRGYASQACLPRWSRGCRLSPGTRTHSRCSRAHTGPPLFAVPPAHAPLRILRSALTLHLYLHETLVTYRFPGFVQRLDTSEARITARYQHALTKMKFAAHSEEFLTRAGVRKVHRSTVQ